MNKEVISLKEKDIEEQSKIKFSLQTLQKFKRRNHYFLRIGKNSILPFILLIQEPNKFTLLKLQELLSILRSILPFELGMLDNSTIVNNEEINYEKMAKYINNSIPQCYKSEYLTFTYQFRITQPKYCVLIKSEILKKDLEEINENKEEKNYYNGFMVFKYTLAIEIIENKEIILKEADNKKIHSISHYFVPPKMDNKKSKFKKKNSKKSKNQKYKNKLGGFLPNSK